MGTKREIVPHVHESLQILRRRPRRFVDLFAGTGTVAASLAGEMSITFSDALGFPTALAKARFLQRSKPVARGSVLELHELAIEYARRGLARRRETIGEETDALRSGYQAMRELIQSARHAGNDRNVRGAAVRAKSGNGYSLTTLYFARGYFSTTQAVYLDAYRRAIDELYPASNGTATSGRLAEPRDVLLAAWLVTASRIMNGPGHTAQFLHSRNHGSYLRVAQAWARDPSREFGRSVSALNQLGMSDWRRRNRVMQHDATAVPDEVSRKWRDGVLYADPPYTKDHYSRYYHVLETLFMYDYPTSSGVGRVRDDRHLSDFCYRTRAAQGFAALGDISARTGSPLLISYPSAGLISSEELRHALDPFGKVRLLVATPHRHSTMGGSPGRASTEVTERIYVLTPR